MTAKEELCIVCDEPTGRAGLGEDSLSVTFPDGSVHEPLCEACFDRYEKVRVELTKRCPKCTHSPVEVRNIDPGYTDYICPECGWRGRRSS